VKKQDGERGSDSTFIARKQNFKTRIIFRHCPVVLLVKVGWRQDIALGGEESTYF
jgi:hypothetical protein